MSDMLPKMMSLEEYRVRVLKRIDELEERLKTAQQSRRSSIVQRCRSELNVERRKIQRLAQMIPQGGAE